MAIMNSIFAAQKSKVSIDSCVLGEDSTFLQQASEITGGTYVRVMEHSKLTQYLLGVFLMGVEFRKSFHTPPAAKVGGFAFANVLCCETSYIDRQIPQFLDHKHYYIPIYLFVALYSEHFLVLLAGTRLPLKTGVMTLGGRISFLPQSLPVKIIITYLIRLLVLQNRSPKNTVLFFYGFAE